MGTQPKLNPSPIITHSLFCSHFHFPVAHARSLFPVVAVTFVGNKYLSAQSSQINPLIKSRIERTTKIYILHNFSVIVVHNYKINASSLTATVKWIKFVLLRSIFRSTDIVKAENLDLLVCNDTFKCSAVGKQHVH